MDIPSARVNLLDTWIDKVDTAEACNRIQEFVRSGIPQQIVTVNLDFLRLAVRDRSFRDLINTSSLVVPDGMPLIWASRVLGDPLPERVAGVDLVRECARLADRHHYRIFLLGAAPGVADRAANVLRTHYPSLHVAGTHSPTSLDEEQDEMTLRRIRAAEPDMLFVAFGAPRQDHWIRKHMQALGVPVSMGVGGAFDMLSGRIDRAPEWMQQTGMEWLYRFGREPGRLWKRYFVHDLPIFMRLMAHATTSAPADMSLAPMRQIPVLEPAAISALPASPGQEAA